MNQTILIEELLKNSKKFVANTRIWDDYPRTDSMNAIATFLDKVIIPSLEECRKPKQIAFGVGAADPAPEIQHRRGSNTPITKRLRGEIK